MNASVCAAPVEKPANMNKLLAIVLLWSGIGLTACNYPGLSIHCIFSKSRPDIDLKEATPYLCDSIKKEDGFDHSAYWDLNKKEHLERISAWWQATDNFGTEYIFPYGTKGVTFILSRNLTVTFEAHNRIHFAYTIFPENDDHRTFRYGRSATAADAAFLEYLLSVKNKETPFSFEEWKERHPNTP